MLCTIAPMKLIILFLNLPFTFTGIFPLIVSGPKSIKLIKNPYALLCEVRGFWWAFGYLKNSRAMTIGNIILLSPNVLKNDLEHELIHVKQCDRYPVIFPFLYLYELLVRGYRQNRFEDEAYTLSKSIYKGK